jgi:trk system potassium uptake protein
MFPLIGGFFIMFFKDRLNRFGFHKLRPVQVLALGFAGMILLGGILLTLPISSASGQVTPFIDAIFTATSAACVTGLVVFDTGTYWSIFGQIVILLLVQTGGLGFMAFATFFAILLGKRISLKERLIMQEAYNAFNIQGMVKLMIYILGTTLAIEGIGAIILASQFIPIYGWGKGIYFGIFHSVTSFCNAGFDLIGDFNSLVPFAENPVIILTTGALIIIGGLGFAVIAELINIKENKRLSLHTKVVLTASAILIVVGAVLFFCFEFANPRTMGPLSIKGKLISSLFASITPRTAGFNSISTTDMTIAGQFLTMILMFIGAGSGSTGGGIKVSTAALLFMTVVAVVDGREETEMYKKRVNRALVNRALAITTISAMLVGVVTMLLAITQYGLFIQFLYEATSAFATVGLTLGFTTEMDSTGKAIIAITMYAGRVGPLTLTLALAHKQNTASSAIRYPEDKILVG